MLKAARREKEGYFDEESIENFSCDDLRTIDQLWLKYSQGRFSFSVQKKIWLEVGGKFDDETRFKFNYRVGWQKSRLVDVEDLTFNKQAPVGHLPGGRGVGVGWMWGGGFVWGFVWVLSRIKSCNL